MASLSLLWGAAEDLLVAALDDALVFAEGADKDEEMEDGHAEAEEGGTVEAEEIGAGMAEEPAEGGGGGDGTGLVCPPKDRT